MCETQSKNDARLTRFSNDRATTLFEILGISALLLMLLIAYFWRVVFLGESLVPTDMIFQFPAFQGAAPANFARPTNALLSDVTLKFYPWQVLVRDSLSRGHFPLWNPFIFAGTPLFANAESAALDPVNLLGCLFEHNDSYGIRAILRMWLAGLGMFLFVRSLGASRAGSLVSSVTFMFSGSMVVWLNYPVGAALCWLPWLFFVCERVVTSGRPIWAASIALILAVQIMGGHYQTVFIGLLACSLYVLARLLVLWREAHNLRQLITLGMLFAVGILIGLLLTGVQLVPFSEWLDQTNEIKSRLAHKNWQLIHPSFIPSAIMAATSIWVPNMFGNPTWGSTVSFLYSNYIEETLYVGIAPLVMALIAIGSVRKHTRWPVRCEINISAWRPTIIILAMLASVFLAFAVQLPFFDLVTYLPVFNVVAVPRYRFIFTVCVAALAGFGADILLYRLPDSGFLRRLERWILIGSILTASLLLAIAFLLMNSGEFFRAFGRIRDQYALLRWAFSPTNSEMYFPVAVGVAFAGWILSLRHRWLSFQRATAVLIVLVFVDLFIFGSKFNPSLPSEAVFPEPPAVRFIKAHQEESEPVRIMALNNDMPANTGTPFGLMDVSGSDFPPSNYVELTRLFGAELFGTNRIYFSEIKPVFLDMLNVCYLIVSEKDGDFVTSALRKVYTDTGVAVFQNARCLPRAYMVYTVQVVAGEEETLKELASPEFDPHRQVVLNEFPSLVLPPSLPQTGDVHIVEYLPEYIDIEVETFSPGLLVISDAYYPGWQAWVDGQPAKIYRANHALRAVEISPGKHRVEFRYLPTSLQLGFLLSVIGGIMLISLPCLNFKKK